jgi:hypothetical protein
MTIDWSRIIPVIVSVAIIIAVAILRESSRNLAAIVATMPINVPLGMWIVYSGTEDRQAALADFSEAILLNILPSMAFIVVAWQMSKAGQSLLPTIVVGYIVWAVGLGIVFLLRTLFMR